MIRNTIRLALIAAAATGGVMALIKTAKTPPLEAEYKRLYRLVGELPVTDPTRAWMVKLPNDDRLVHQWRVYLPANYRARIHSLRGLISADSPRARDNESSINRVGATESNEFVLTIAFAKNLDGQWELHHSTERSRGKSDIRGKLAEILESGDFVLDSFAEGDPVMLADDDVTCVVRIRAKMADPMSPPDEPLYRGYYLYVVPESYQGTLQTSKPAPASNPSNPGSQTPR